MSHSAVDHIEHGRRNTSIEAIGRLASALEVTLEELLGGDSHAPTGRAAIIARVAAVIPHLPQDELDVFVHELALWERRYLPGSSST
jgi:transcriptional regulator with XRE-family HTH domain